MANIFKTAIYLLLFKVSLDNFNFWATSGPAVANKKLIGGQKKAKARETVHNWANTTQSEDQQHLV